MRPAAARRWKAAAGKSCSSPAALGNRAVSKRCDGKPDNERPILDVPPHTCGAPTPEPPMSRTPQPYVPPAWLPGNHAQTIWPLTIKGVMPRVERERWESPDGDFIHVDFLPHRPGKPLVVLFHG